MVVVEDVVEESEVVEHKTGHLETNAQINRSANLVLPNTLEKIIIQSNVEDAKSLFVRSVYR